MDGQTYTCKNGPFHGKTICLATQSSLPFKVGGYRGRYQVRNDYEAHWEPM